MINTALLNDIFLNELFRQKERQIYARITVLTQDECAIESIEGRVSGGSINVDGDSIIRRSCSINLVANENLDINEFYWGFKNKFKLEIGLSNNVDNSYDNVIWFPQGIFLITNFDCNYTAKKYEISIKGKDKMCLLNGEMGGTIPYNTDFGKEEYLDVETDTKITTDIPIQTIVQEMIRNYANELPQNIIINDIKDAGLELLEYRGNVPMFLLRPVDSDVFENITFNEEQECYYLNDKLQLEKTVIGDSDNIIYDNLVSLEGEQKPSKIILTMVQHNSLTEEDFNLGIYYVKNKQVFIDKNKNCFIDNSNNYFINNNTSFDYATTYEPNEVYYSIGEYYYIARFDTGSAPGYRLTDLTYAGELIANAGDSITSILDKIKNMLGDFEYFYNLDGKFVFQKRQRYNSSNWYNAEMDEVIYNDATLNMNKPIFSFLDNELITSFKNTPKMENMKNDYSVWGTRKLDSGTERQIHARYAIDIKPKFYKTYDGHFYISDTTYIKDVQKNLNHTMITKLTPMIEINNITEEEFNSGIYYKRNSFYFIDSNGYIVKNTSTKKYFALLKNYIYDNKYDKNATYYQTAEDFVHIVDWREIIYQMALDYRKHYHDTDFLYNIAQNNLGFYPTGITGYERYYTDLEGFWRELYNPNPDPIGEYVSAADAIKCHDRDELYVTNSFRKLNDKERDQYLIDLNQLYILDYNYEVDDPKAHQTPEITPFFGSKYCHLTYKDEEQIKSNEVYFFSNENGTMNNGSNNADELNQILLGDIYTKERGPFITLEGYDEETGVEERNYYYVKEKVKPGYIFPDINDGQNKEENEIITPNYDKLEQFLDVDGLPFYDANSQWFLIQKTIDSKTPYTLPYKSAKSAENTSSYATYQYWVYKYPFGTKLGQYPDDYLNFAAQQFENYLNEYGWDKLYIKDSSPIKFSDLDEHIQRLYYKQTSQLTEYLRILQYNNFNQLRTNLTELEAALLLLNKDSYSSFDLFNTDVKNIVKEYINEYSPEAQVKAEEIYKIKQLNTETERDYLNRLKTAMKDYIGWFEAEYPEQVQKPYYKEESVSYQTIHYNFNVNAINGDYWNKDITNSPETLDFWFDFINGEISFLSKYSIQTIGPRPKVINDSAVKAIYYKEVPNIIFITSQEEKEKYDIQTGYNYIQLPQEMQSIFVISSRGKSATNAIEDLIYQHCYASETASISTIPIYHLQPNTCIYINNDNTNINGDYLISKISIPLDAKKQMNITATKVIPSIL